MPYVIMNNGMMPLSNYLSHHGIKGQRWYHRRWQNEDGSYTEAGRIRYGIGKKRELKNNVAKRKTAEKLIKQSNKATKQAERLQKSRIASDRKRLSEKHVVTVNKQYEKAHELIGDSEKLHGTINAYDIASDAYDNAMRDFLADKEKYAKVVDAQIEQDKKYNFYGSTEEELRDFYNGGEGSQAIMERFELSDEHMQALHRNLRDAQNDFRDTAKELYDEALGIYGDFPVKRKDPISKKAYSLAEDLAERELSKTLFENRRNADKFLEDQTAKEEFSKLSTEEQNRYLTKVAERQFEEDTKSGELDELNEIREAKNMRPITKDDYVYEAINGDGNEGYNAWKEYAKDRKSSGTADKNEASKQTAKSEKPEYIDKVETKNGDTRYFYDKSELKAYKDGRSGASDKDLEKAFKKMRSTAKTGEEVDRRENAWDTARDKDLWDMNFLEAVQNSVALEKGDSKTLLTEYAYYLADPEDYWKNRGKYLKDM